MKREKAEKCSYGYINWQKRRQLTATLLLCLLAAVIFLTGYLLNDHSKNNVFTIVAVLLVLPMAKHLVNVVVLFPFQTPKRDLYDRTVKAASETAVVFSDYVFTSQEKVMYLSSMVLQGNEIIGLVGRSKENVAYMKEYLTRSMKQRALPYQVTICTEEEAYLSRIKKGRSERQDEATEKEALEFLRAGAV